ncbi:hypothetical protein Drorol1_Dr00028178 [Drosera rotundifolia]
MNPFEKDHEIEQHYNHALQMGMIVNVDDAAVEVEMEAVFKVFDKIGSDLGIFPSIVKWVVVIHIPTRDGGGGGEDGKRWGGRKEAAPMWLGEAAAAWLEEAAAVLWEGERERYFNCESGNAGDLVRKGAKME